MNPNKKLKESNFRLFSLRLQVFLLLISIIILILSTSEYLKFSKPLESSYIKLPESPKFEGNLLKNNLLEKVEYIAKGKLRGPETIIFINDTLYTGLLNGQIVRVDEDGNVHKVVQGGDEENIKLCNDFGNDIKSHRECGRPLGLRYKSPNWLYFIDAYHGLFKIDLFQNEKIQILSANDELFKNEPLVFGNDLDIDDYDNIYFTDSSTIREVNEAVELHVEARPDGRVFRFNERTKELELLIKNLVFPNGIQLNPEKNSLVIAEHGMARLIEYFLSGLKKGQYKTLVNLPGFPDNIRISNHNTLFVGFAASRHPSKPVLLELLGEYPLIRNILGAIFNLRLLSFKLPKYALAAEYEFSGNLLNSWHDPNGKLVECTTCVTLHKNKLYFGSFYIDHISTLNYIIIN